MYKQLKRLTVYEKTGYHNATGNRVRLLDKRGIVFYDTGELNHPVFEFNLPAGEYFIESGRFSKMARPVNFPLLPLDNYDRPTKRGNPDLFKLVFEDNPATAQIDWTAKTIYFDNKLKDASLPVLNLILEHEYAHKYYANEDSCDRMAYNQMIERGYNPSQIGFAFDDTITNRSCERIGSDIVTANSKKKGLDSFDNADKYILGSGDMKFDTADDFLGGTLIALKQIIKYTRPNGTRHSVVNTGAKVGIIESYVQPGDGSVWWMLTDGTFVKQSDGNFDKDVIRQSVIANEAKRASEIQTKVDERLASNTNPLYNFGKLFNVDEIIKWVILGLIGYIVVKKVLDKVI